MATSVGSVVFSISADIKDIQAQLRKIEGDFAGTATKIQSSLKSVGTSIGQAFAVTAVGGGLLAFTKSIVEASVAVERVHNTLKVVAGSSADAKAEFSFIASEAKRLGLDLQQAAGQYAALAAAAKGTTLQGEKTRDIFVAVSEAAAVLGLSAEQTGGALNAIQQIISKGTVQSEELRGQLGERLPGAFQIAARAMGVTTAELGKLLEGGKITGDVLLPKLAAELKKTFGPGVADAANSTQAAINRLNNSILEMKVALANTGFIDVIKTAMEGWALISGELRKQIDGIAFSFGKFSESGANQRIGSIDKQLASLRAEFNKLDSQGFKGESEGRRLGRENALRENIDARKKLLEERAKLEGEISGKAGNLISADPKAKPSVPPKAGGTDKLKDALDGYVKSLQRAIAKEEEQRIKLQFGELVALKAAQAFDVLALKEKLLADGLKIPPNVASDVAAATETLRQLGVNVDQLSSKDFPKLRDEYLKQAEGNERITRALKALDEQYSVSNENTAKQTELTKEQAAELAKLRKEYDDLVQTLQVSAIKDPEKRRIAGIEVEFAKTAARIQELGQATGKSQEEIARAMAIAWDKYLNEINDKVDESSQFQIEALRQIQDAVGSFINDALNGNLKGWQAWADGVRKAINSVVSQFLAAKLNEFLFGPKSSTSQGQLGGAVGQGFSGLSSLFGSFFGGGSSTVAGTGGVSAGALDSLVTVFGYAEGGRPRPFMPAIVGERGPEIFIPDAAGTIVPNHKLGGLGGTVVNFNVTTPDAASFRASEHHFTTQFAARLARANNR